MMRAKMVLRSVEHYEGSDSLHFSAVSGKDPYGPNGESEDNTYARYTPRAELSMTVNNPNLVGKFKVDQTFYVDFTEASE